MTPAELATRRATLVDCVQRRAEQRAAELAEWDSVQDVAAEIHEATQAVDGEDTE
jgi:hypothetical protein